MHFPALVPNLPWKATLSPYATHEARPESGRLYSTYFHHHFDYVCGYLVKNFVQLISLCSSGIYASLFEAGCMPLLL